MTKFRKPKPDFQLRFSLLRSSPKWTWTNWENGGEEEPKGGEERQVQAVSGTMEEQQIGGGRGGPRAVRAVRNGTQVGGLWSFWWFFYAFSDHFWPKSFDGIFSVLFADFLITLLDIRSASWLSDHFTDHPDHFSSGSFVLAKGRCWCPEHFVCANSG